MKKSLLFSTWTVLIGVMLSFSVRLAAQPYPGGVSTGTTRGYKVDYYNGSFANVSTAFGAGTANANPGMTGYSGRVTGIEFWQLDNTYFGLEYTGILEIPVTGTYGFVLENIDDEAALYIDNVLKVTGIYAGGPTNASTTVFLTAGDHPIKVKYRNGGGPGNVELKFFGSAPAGSGISFDVYGIGEAVNANHVRYEGAKLTAWYKASDVIYPYDRVTSFVNKAPDYAGNGNLPVYLTPEQQGGYGHVPAATVSNSTQVNFNPGVKFDGDDIFQATSQKGLSYRNATKSMFLVSQPTTSGGVTESGKWIFYHDNGTSNNNQSIGLYRNNATTQFAISGGGNAAATPYTLNEPRLLSGYLGLPVGADKALSSLLMTTNGSTGTPTDLWSNVEAGSGLVLKNMATSSFTESIYYPFELSAAQRQRVNTYLAVKYGITLQHDYVSAAGATIFSLSTNAGYTSRIFGIGNETTAQALHQKQSQSQMTGAANGGYDFLLLSKSATITTTNAANTGSLPDGSYLIVGDNSAVLGKQSGELPASYVSACALERITREWKAQVTGTPGPVTIRVGSSTSGSFLFPGYASGLKLVVDGDQDGDFTTGGGMQRMYDPASYVNGVATFNNVTLNNGEVFTFVWAVTSPGGVSNGLVLWLRGDAGTSTTTHGTATTTWNDQSSNVFTLNSSGTSTYRNDTAGNFNPYISFSGSNYFSVPAGFANFTGGASSFFVANLANTSQNYVRFFDFGNGAASNNIYFGKYATQPNLMVGGFNGATGGAYYTSSSPVVAGTNRIYSYVMPGGTPGATASPVTSADGATQTTGGNPSVISGNVTRSNNYIGKSNWSGDDWFIGSMSEGILYNTALSAADQLRINSYLAVKYGRTLSSSLVNYMASNGTTVLWNNTTYWNNVFGIGRDDCSGLLQKQSKSTTGGDNVIMGLGTIAATNAANTATLTSNLQFILVGNDGGALIPVTTNIPAAYTSLSCNANRYARTWKVKNTGNVTNTLQIQVGNSASPIRSNWTKVELAVNGAGDNTFATGTTTLYPAVSVSGGVATFNNVSLPEGAVFTVCFTIGYPGGVSKPSNGITITTGSGATQNNINGLTYKYYTLGTAIGSGQSVAAGFGAYNPTLRSSGYFNNATNFHSILIGSGNAPTTNTGLELSGKLNVITGGTYLFRGNAIDDRLAVIIDGATVLDATATGTFTSGNVNLAAGYHDIIIRGGNLGGAIVYDLTWSNNGGSTYTAIPDANFFTSVQNPSAWYTSDDNQIVLADGTSMNGQTWYDQSSNNNTLTGASGPVYYNTNAAFIRNYNPSINFSKSYFTTANTISGGLYGFAYGNLGKSIVVMGANLQTGDERIYTGYGRDAVTGNNFGLTRWTNGRLSVFTGSNNLDEVTGFYAGQTAASTYDIISGILTRPNGAAIYANGTLRATGTLGSNFFTTMNDNTQLQVGSAPDYSSSINYTGVLNEVMHYPWTLSANEQQRINSYLAIKWGITLNQGMPTNYLASDGATIWNAATAGAFNRDITGIGRDDCSALNQLQSTSTDDTDIVSMGRGIIAATNTANTNTFGADKTFLVWARNSGDLNANNTNLPASLIGCYVKLNREWQVQTTGTPGTVSVQFGKTGLFSINAANYKPVLLISNTAGNYSSATVIPVDSVRRGRAYFSNVTFTNGQYFTLGYINAAPGGVTQNMTVWFNSDYDAFTDAAQTTYAENDGDPVASMNNMKFGSPINAVSQVSAAYNPTYRPGTFNYNTGILFDGSNDVLATAGNVNTTTYRSTTTMTSVFAGKNVGTGSNQNVFWYHEDASGGASTKTSMERGGVFWYGTTGYNRNPTLTNPELYSYLNSTSGSLRLLSNLKTVGTATATSTSTANGRFRIGSNSLSASGSPGNFYLGEFVIYNDDKGASNTLAMRQIHSYLATKYGFTLDAASVNNAYIASNGTTETYNYTNFWNRITGIGRDDCSAFEQKQSFSQEASGALVRISNDPNGLAATNAANTAGFANNFSFLLFGDNGKDLTWTGVDKVPGNLVRLNRVWRVKETGTVSTVYLQVPASSSTQTVKLPVSDDVRVYLLVSGSGNFKAPDATIEMTDDGSNNLYATYDFQDGDYYTFASKKSCIAPAGISDGLKIWYRTEDMTVGSIGTSVANALTDRTGNHNLASSGSGTYNIVAGTAATNYNRYLSVTGGGSVLKTNVNETSLSAADVGTLYAVGLGNNSSNDYLFGLSRANMLGMGTYANGYFGNVAQAYPGGTAGVAGVMNTFYTVKSATQLFAGVNGTTAFTNSAATIPAGTDYNLRIGSRYVGATLTWNPANFAEAFSYNRTLSAAEQQVLNTYLALKYGQTLPHNYYSPSYDGTNAATTTIYDVSTYGNRVFGVGMDSAGCFSQKQSNSVLPGSMLKVSIANAIAAENNGNAGTFAIDRTYVAAGDNNGAITWNASSAEIPAWYTGKCIVPRRIDREWKFKALNDEPELRITIPDVTSVVGNKLDALPAGYTKVYMVINDNPDFTVNVNQDRIAMELVGTEWVAYYAFPKDVYKYVTFVTGPDEDKLQPVLVIGGSQEVENGFCASAPYIYYRGNLQTTDAIIAVNPNGNEWNPLSLTVNNQGNLSGGGGNFSNTGTGYYQSTDFTQSIRISKRMHTIEAPGTYEVNGGVIVRLYYSDADMADMLSNAMPDGNPIIAQGWFKASTGSASQTVGAMVPGDLPGGHHIEPVASGVEKGVKYVEFLVNSFSTFGYYAKTSPNALPVELLSFEASRRDNGALLSWSTASEKNNYGFNIERSQDAKTWENIGFVKSQADNGNSNKRLDYSYTDFNPLNGTNYYRLKQEDFDGAYEYSPVRAVDFSGNLTLKWYPNPTSGIIYLSGELQKDIHSIVVTDAIGRQAYHKQVSSDALRLLDLSMLSPGTYQISFIGDNFILTNKLVIQQ